ncbi:MAG: hypothetical protein ACFB20_00410 [Opitutales bacterium]
MKLRLLAVAAGVVALSPIALHGAPSGTYGDWRLQVWGPIDGANDAISGPDADPDADSIQNALEYILGLDPTSPDSSPFDALDMTQGANMTFRFSQFDNAVGSSVWAEYATDLTQPSPWVSADGTVLNVVTDGVNGAQSGVASSAFQGTLSGPGTAFLRLAANVDVDATAPNDSLQWVWVETGGGTNNNWPGLSANNIQWFGANQSRSINVNIPADDTYSVWVRKRWEQPDWEWRVGTSGPWNQVPGGPGIDVVQYTNPPNNGDRVAWFFGGEVELTAGNHTVQYRQTELGSHGWDNFLFINQPFVPSGELQPDELGGTPEPGRFIFEADADTYTFSPIDMRFLNEPFAGSKGFIATQGEDFIHSDTGEKVRFWAANLGSGIAALDRSQVDELARHLAKRGVNLVRYHSPFWVQSGGNFGNINESKLDDIFYLVAAMRREGIYTGFSIYFPLWADYWDLAGYQPPSGTSNTFAALYYDPALQAIYRNFWTQLLTRVNPYTGVELRNEPAVAYAEMVNEDSLLFWTFTPRGNIPQQSLDILEPLFGTWAANKYGSLQNAFDTWNQPEPNDDAAAGIAGFDNGVVFNATSQADSNNGGPITNWPRLRDAATAAFLAQQQTTFHEETYDFLKIDLGFKGMITGSNWRTADARVLDPLDKWSNTVGDFMDRHGYYGSSVTGTNSSFDVLTGQTYYDRSATKFQSNQGADEGSFNHVSFDLRHNNLPSIISETDHSEPNRFRAEQPFIHSAYASLQGSDGIVYFTITGPTFTSTVRKWPMQSPLTLGQFPAFAYIYRKFLVQEGSPVAEFDLLLDDLFALEGAPVSAPQNFDQLREEDIPPGGSIPDASSIDPLAFIVGKVGLNYVTSDPTSDVISLETFIDRTAKVATSITSELFWDWGNGVIYMQTPQAQGATGFLGSVGTISLGDITVATSIEYGTLVAVALDDKALSQSGKILLQIGTEERPTGWTETGTSPGPKTITSLGNAPFQLKTINGTFSLNRADAGSLTISPLDFNGYRTDVAPSVGVTNFALQPDVIYYLIED